MFFIDENFRKKDAEKRFRTFFMDREKKSRNRRACLRRKYYFFFPKKRKKNIPPKFLIKSFSCAVLSLSLYGSKNLAGGQSILRIKRQSEARAKRFLP